MLESLVGIDSKIDLFLDSYKENPLVILYGAGFAMPAILDKLESNGFSVVAICDSDIRKQGSSFRDRYPIISVEEARRQFPEARFLISSPDYYWEIQSLLKKAVDPQRLCDVDLECAHYFKKGEFQRFFTAELPRFKEIYRRLEDGESKNTFFKVVRAHMSGERRDFEEAFTGAEDWYLFKSLLKPTHEAIYVDCGAYDGDTVKLFLDAAEGGYRKVFAFEPDPKRFPSLQAVSAGQDDKIEIVPKGVSDRDGTISFMANGVYSNIVKDNTDNRDGLISIPIAKLDSVLVDEPVSIVKMDIEGGEYDALMGAAQLIQRCKPKLAICLYHKVEDFVRIAELILQLVPEYKLRLRHQSKSCTDTILFATLD